MPLGDALYTITMSSARPSSKTNADWTLGTTGTGWGTTSNTLVKVDNMIYLTAVTLHTDVNVEAAPHFLEMYLNNTDEGSFIWSGQLTRDSNLYTVGQKNNEWTFMQPIRANEVYFGVRAAKPYPSSRGSNALIAMNGTESLLTVMQTPRNFT